jgi:putative component of membrane protein insertase Oxa1/YidC/SpoIIIJ protein YidD
VRNALRTIGHLPRKLICAMIDVYQATLSPDHGPLKALYPYGCCMHEPTCSEYAKQRITDEGLWKGGMKAGWRILCCNPWNKPDDATIMKRFTRIHDGSGSIQDRRIP